jgi:hypothetical protein
VIQLAKRDGLKVIASAGSDEKVQFMREIGADVAFNYKSTDTREVLAREGPIDVYVPPSGAFLWSAHPCGAGRYWDNVGGKMLDAALEHAALHGRILVRPSVLSTEFWNCILMTPCRNAGRSQVRIRARLSKQFLVNLTGYNTGYEPVMVCNPLHDLCQLYHV